ncbi:MAG: pyridoxine 5'-phosphate synthase [Verrucomicrobiota bacterium]
MSESKLKLGVNIDHVATLRNARYVSMLDAANTEPSVLAAAHEVEAAGADSITVHLRADRRHIVDSDVFELRENIRTKLNLEMGNTQEILNIALKVKPDFACLVPENREEVTTEGGLDVKGADESLQRTIDSLRESGVRVSLFVDPVVEQIEAAAKTGAEMIELHTGAFANAAVPGGQSELAELIEAANVGHELGLQINAGHGITLSNLATLMQVPHLAELNVGHHLISRALFVGLSRTVQSMLAVMQNYPLPLAQKV